MKNLNEQSKLKVYHIAVTGILIGIVVGVGIYLLFQNHKKQQQLKDPSVAAVLESQQLVKKAGRFIALPENELPTIATVSDYQKLQDQPFFEKSQNGDKVLIYTKAKKAYLYRPKTDKLIDVTIVNIESSIPDNQEVKIILRNGTSSIGLTNKIEPEVKKILPSASIVAKQNAAATDYQDTQIIVINKDVEQQASILANFLKAKIVNMPVGENRPAEGDIVIIIGKDKVL